MSTTQNRQPNAYLKTKVMTASPAELRLMLLDGAVRFAEQGREGLEKKDFEQVYNGVSQCQKILMELINGLNHEVEPTLCRRLSALYTYMYTSLIKASSEKSIEKVDEVLELLRYERETWQMLMDRLARENAGAATVEDLPDARPDAESGDGDDDARSASLVGGSISIEG